MKTIKYIAFSISLFIVNILNAGNYPQEIITISSPRFSKELIKTWIIKYQEIHPQVHIELNDDLDNSADINFISNDQNLNLSNGQEIIFIGRFALLPIVNIQNPLYKQIVNHKLNTNALKSIFFEKDALQEVENKKHKYELFDHVTVYSATNRVTGAKAFASHFGLEASQLRGKRIAGDDLFLITAINKDHTGITFNHLGYVFDLDSRKLKPQIALLPLDLKKEQEESFESSDLDKIINLLETDHQDLIPIENIGFVYNKKDAVTEFLYWIINEGQQYNHNFGFLALDKKVALKEQKQLETQLLTDY